MKLTNIATPIPPSIAEIGNLIPAQYVDAWQRAIASRKQKQGSFNKTVKDVISGKKALLYGWRADIIKNAAAEAGLETIDIDDTTVVAFLPPNRDMAELMMWGHNQSIRVQGTINGVLLYYPLDEVDTWVSKNVTKIRSP